MSDQPKNNRLTKFLLVLFVLLVIGILYLLFVSITGIGIPCPIHALTGFKCPGCGITIMFVCIAKLDFAGAIQANAVTFFMLPVIIALIVYFCYRYLKYGSLSTNKFVNCVLIGIVVLYVAFGIVRNIFGF